MNFKSGDIVTREGDHKDIVFKIHYTPRFRHYHAPWGTKSREKKWMASGQHIGLKYNGTWCGDFNLEHCVLYNPILKIKKLKKFNMT